MNHVIYLLLRRLRMPLITLIVVYSVSIIGFVLIPGMDDQGNPWRMSFFHATYFVSFMGSTIGFGEIPYPFTDAQRMWALVTIYATVVSWLYGIGSTLAAFQEPVFGRMMRRRSFAGEVSRFQEPFYLICGYGVTGSVIVSKLARRDIRTVVVDIAQDRLDALEMDNLPIRVPGLCADAALPDVLDDAGIQHDKCIGVLALTNNDNVNLAIAIASKLLTPDRMVISRTESSVTTSNLESFGTDLVVDPFRSYAQYLALTAHSPYKHLVYDWLINPTHRPLSSAYKETRGRWIICGFGRFGQALYEEFRADDVPITLIDPQTKSRQPDCDLIIGVGTEAVTLQAAGIEDAVGIIAGTNNDADNLSIIMTALALNPKLVTVVRQNIHANRLVFDRSGADFVMEPGRIIANRILASIKSPLLPVFIQELLDHNDVWAHTLLNRMSNEVGDSELESWSLTVGETDAPAVIQMLNDGDRVRLIHLMKDPRDRLQVLDCFALLMRRTGEVQLQPGELNELMPGDELLFCGTTEAYRQMQWTISNFNMLHYVLKGDDASNNLLSRLLKKRDC